MLITKLRQPDTPCSWECPKYMNPILHRLLLTRGVKSDEEARMYLHPSREMLRDPFLLSDMSEAVRIIKDAISKGESICVYGDYDVDGVCASAILTLYLKEIGAKCDVYLPSRHTEGYGLNADAVDFIAGRHSLLVTVDCGITAFDLVERAKAAGMRVVVTDHHRPDERIPDCPTVNPLLNGYPFGFLCGAGVAFQLVTALAGRDKAMEYIDLAALATIADIVPLRDENRAIAFLGLKKLNISSRPGVRALIKVSGLEGKEISAGNVAFQKTPRLNAGGRIGDAKRAYDLLTSCDIEVCEALAQELDQENINRKSFENRAFTETEKQLESFDFTSHGVIYARGEDWNPGVIGLAASRITEKYHYPSVALTREGDCYIGSCRSIDGIDIQEALTHVGYLLERFGGHRMAAGLKVKAENLERFMLELDEYITNAYDDSVWIPVTEYDARVEGSELTAELVEQLALLAPTGCQNPGAVFITQTEIAEAYGVGKEKEHLKLTFKTCDGTRLPGIWFRHGDEAARLSGGADAIYSPSINEYMGQRSVQAEIKSVLPLSKGVECDEAAFAAFILDITGKPEEKPYAPVTLNELKQHCQKHHKGNLIIAAESNFDFPPQTDVLKGEYPSDPRLFNALCVCPVGSIPKGYKHIYFAGLPGFLCRGGAKINGIAQSRYFSREYIPGKDTLRDICRSFLRASKTGRVFKSELDAALFAGREAGISPVTAAFGVCVLRHMGSVIFECTQEGLCVRFSGEKKQPEDDSLYALLTGMR